MGLCMSSEKEEKTQINGGGGGGGRESDLIKRSTTIKVIQSDGKLQEFKQPVKAGSITSQNPGCFLCSSESMSIDSFLPQIPEDEDLQAGHIYFLLPLSRARKQLSLPDLCALAIKASSALGEEGFSFGGFSSRFL